MKYSGVCKQADIQFSVSFEVNNGRVDNFVPPDLEDVLFVSAMVAHINYQNLQVHGIMDKLPTSITIIQQHDENEPFPRQDTGDHQGTRSEGTDSVSSEPSS